jgi:hypothetical protein
MFRRIAALVIATIALGVGGFAASAAIKDGPPAGATAICKDGTFSFSQTRSWTCSHHGGVATWLTPSDNPPATTSAPPAATTAAHTTTAITTTTAVTTTATPRTTTAATTTAITTTAKSTTTPSKTCRAGYVSAQLSWGNKCLRAGEFCKVGNREYLKYGFTCPPNGHLKRRK